MSKRVAMYLRVSTNLQTVENQRLELEKYCERQGWTVAKVYEDSGYSGSKSDRPALNEMLKDSARGKFDVVMVWKIDRLARSTSDLLNILTTLKNNAVDFCATTQNIDTTNAMGRMIFTFLAAISEFELDLIKSRIFLGIQRAKANGVRLGRPRVGFDYNRALQLKREGFSWSQIAKDLKVSSATIRRMVTPMLHNTVQPA